MKRAQESGGSSKTGGGPRPPPSNDYEVDSDEDRDFKNERTASGGNDSRNGGDDDAAVAVVAAPLPSSLGGGGTATGGESKVELDLTDMREFVTNPVPYGAGVVRCYIERKKTFVTGGLFRKSASYVLHLKEGNTFVLAARKRKLASKSGSSYAIALDLKDINTKSSNYVGR